MSNGISRWYPSSAPGNVPLRRVQAQILETEIKDAIQRLRVATSNVYDNISVLSTYWGSDDTGGDKDSSLFIETIQRLRNVDAHKCILSQGHCDMNLVKDVYSALPPRTSNRKLFIFHYAGHGIPGTTFITPKIGQKPGKGPELDLSRLKNDLKAEASCQNLDVLFVVDSRLTPIAVSGWGSMAKGARIESVAGVARKGVTNSDGRTFTEHWCTAFNKLLDTGKSFTSEDIVKNINSDSEPEQFPPTLQNMSNHSFSHLWTYILNPCVTVTPSAIITFNVQQYRPIHYLHVDVNNMVLPRPRFSHELESYQSQCIIFRLKQSIWSID